jgi:hypothetical protein
MPEGLAMTGQLNGYAKASWVNGGNPKLDARLITELQRKYSLVLYSLLQADQNRADYWYFASNVGPHIAGKVPIVSSVLISL